MNDYQAVLKMLREQPGRQTPEFEAHMSALFLDRWWRGYQLTATATRHVCTCRTELDDKGSGPIYAVRVRNPACNIHNSRPLRARPVDRYGHAPACMCLYGPRHVVGAPGPWVLIDIGHRYKKHGYGVMAFKIHPRCPHHGDARFVWAGTKLYCAYLDERRGLEPWEVEALRRLYSPEWLGRLAEIVLDDEERRGHA
jgi:hypothetical protein